MRGDGDGWVVSARGARRWGKHGAAGLLLRCPDEQGMPTVLLQHRAHWCHHGGTWGLPGGARDSHETPIRAALREAREEAGIPADEVRVRASRATAFEGTGWEYTTVVADIATRPGTTPNAEGIELRWVPEHEVAGYPLHPGLAEAWPGLRLEQVRVIVDTANVVGSRANGWWRDRAAATRALAEEIAESLPITCPFPDGRYGWINHIEMVLEGHARSTGDEARQPAGITFHQAPGSGDDHIVELARGDDPLRTVVITADRGLKERLPGDAAAWGPKRLLGWLP
ncbi:NUDIX hydrolase [Lolliginicoccus levis]|uniref:NUDIX hydrolase n=1 Tax=Lolliginicoccus levis TaxID=2919542 RepID=UPI00241CD8C3|nr:NUDIX domain-containing protein [Lolliginicoccus levis]